MSDMDEQALLEVQDLTKWFRVGGGIFQGRRRARYVHAVDDVSFSLRRGTILALVGESGSGKSTIARLLVRLYPPTAGRIRLNGEDALASHGRRALLRLRGKLHAGLR